MFCDNYKKEVTMKKWTASFIVSIALLALIASPVSAQEKYEHKHEKHGRKHEVSGERKSVHNTSEMPAGIAKKGNMPKGLAKKEKTPKGKSKGKKKGWFHHTSTEREEASQ